jgi:hypothetical protein
LQYASLNQNYSTALNDDITAGALNREDGFGAQVGFPQFLFVTPGQPGGEHVYVPRLNAYPRWFVAMGTLNGDTNTNSVYVLVQARPSARWLAVARMNSPGFGPADTPVLDSAGYAVAVPVASTRFAAAPARLASLYSLQLTTGAGDFFYYPFRVPLSPGGNPVSQIGSGKLGWRVSIHWEPFPQPAYALAVPARRAIVIFTVDQQFSWTAISAHAQLPSTNLPAVGQYFYAPWPQFASLAHATSVHLGLRISLETIYDWLAIDPPANSTDAVQLPLGGNGFAGVSSQ